MHATTLDHPVQLQVDYPERPLDRLSSAFRLLAVLPLLAVLATIGGPAVGGDGLGDVLFLGLAGGVLFVPPLLTIVFREKYPRWFYDFNVAYLRFDNRIIGYLFLLRDEYPSVDDEQAVHLELPYPDVRNDLNRWLPLVKWLLAVPHYVVLFVLDVAVALSAVAAWIGAHPEGRSMTQRIARPMFPPGKPRRARATHRHQRPTRALVAAVRSVQASVVRFEYRWTSAFHAQLLTRGMDAGCRPLRPPRDANQRGPKPSLTCKFS